MKRCDRHRCRQGVAGEKKRGRSLCRSASSAHCLKALCETIEAEKFKSAALPRLATGVGGLDWKDVKPLMEKHLAHLSIPVYVYSTYRSGVQAEENG